MSTSGGGWLNALLLVVAIALAVQIGLILLDGRRPVVKPAAVGLWLLVAVPSLLQFRFPVLLTDLRRDPDLIRHHGQVWRVVTSVVVQDGGWAGTEFNLLILAIIAVLAADVWGPVLAPAIFLIAHLAFNTAATFLSTDVGAGNSGATLGLGASMVGLAVLNRPELGVQLRGLAMLAVGVALIVISDGHGIAVLGGLLIGYVAAYRGASVADSGHHAPG